MLGGTALNSLNARARAEGIAVMPSFVRGNRLALFLGVFLTGIAASGSAWSAHQYNLKFKGQTQGTIKGGQPKPNVHINFHPITTHVNIK